MEDLKPLIKETKGVLKTINSNKHSHSPAYPTSKMIKTKEIGK
jgi:hypothetical protein